MPVSARSALREPQFTGIRRTPGRKAAGSADTGERAFAYAKACGIIGKSFVGKRVPALGKLNSLTELDRLVFPGDVRELPGRELLVDLERRIVQRTTRHILAIIDSYSRPPALLVYQLRSIEYADLKACLHHIAAGKANPPALSGIGRFGTVRFNAYPDIAAMLSGTEFEPVLAKDLKAVKSPDHDLTPLEVKLDLHYYSQLVRSLMSLPAADRQIAQRIVAEEISLRNCVWALRLRTYYGKSPEETDKYLMDPQDARFGAVSLAAEARASLRYALDSRPDWKGWCWEKLLNPEKPGTPWIVDPRYFQNAASRYIYRMSLHSFRTMPFSISAIFCYIKLKQFEEDLLTSIGEGLGLGMTGKDVFDLLEAPQ
jgi:vacuolar-type H+-ATPase subunit C/Vma6